MADKIKNIIHESLASQNEKRKVDAKNIEFLQTVRDTAIALGINPGTLCNPADILTVLRDEAKAWYEFAKDSVDNLLSEIGGVLESVVVLLALIAGSTAAAYVDSIVNEMLFGSIIGATYSVVAAFLSVIPGMELALQYLMITRMRLAIRKRLILMQALSRDIEFIFTILDQYTLLFKNEDENSFKELQKAIRNIKRAETILGLEKGRISSEDESSVKIMQINNIKTAEFYINAAINNVSNNKFRYPSGTINAITRKYQLKTTVPNTPLLGEPQGPIWVNYFIGLEREVREKFFVYNAKPNTPEYAAEQKEKQMLFNSFISEMFPFVPKTIQLLLLQESFNQATQNLIEKIPLFIAEIKATNIAKQQIDEAMKEAAKFLVKKSGTNSKVRSENSLKNNPELKDVTLRDLSADIKITETGILLFPSMWQQIRLVGKFYNDVLIAVLTEIKDVRIDIENTIKEAPSPLALVADQLKWIAQLTMAKGKLKVFTSTSAGISIPTKLGENATSLNGAELAAVIEKAGLALEELKEFIVQKSYDVKKDKPRKEPSELIDKFAQQSLGLLIANIGILISPAYTSKLKANLQALRAMFSIQIKMDIKELSLCNKFIAVIEQDPAAQKVVRLLQEFISGLSTSATAGIAKSLSDGDISSIVSFYETGEAISDIVQMFADCGENKSPSYVDQVAEYVKSNSSSYISDIELVKLKERTTATISSLKSTGDMIANATKEFEAVLEKPQETRNSGESTLDMDEFEVDSNFVQRLELQDNDQIISEVL